MTFPSEQRTKSLIYGGGWSKDRAGAGLWCNHLRFGPPFFSLKGEGIKLKINKGPPDIRDPIRGISSLLVELLGLKILRGNIPWLPSLPPIRGILGGVLSFPVRRV